MSSTASQSVDRRQNWWPRCEHTIDAAPWQYL